MRFDGLLQLLQLCISVQLLCLNAKCCGCPQFGRSPTSCLAQSIYKCQVAEKVTIIVTYLQVTRLNVINPLANEKEAIIISFLSWVLFCAYFYAWY